MQDSFFSPYWYRVAALKPILKQHVRLNRQSFRGENWYVVADVSAGRHFRFNQSSRDFIQLLDGQRPVEDAWQCLCTQLADEAPGQEEIIQLLAQLHNADLLQSDVPGDARALFKRQQAHQRKQWQQKLGLLLAIRLPLLDPDRLLNQLYAGLRFLFHWPAVLAWLAVVAAALAQAILHWPELTHNISEQIFTAQNLFLLWLCFPFIKILHELGHGVVCKHYGGEVHEAGITLLVFTPVPYVNASSASSFTSPYRRVLVSAAGILVELFVAALALFGWLLTEPGLVRSICFNLVLIGSVSTLLFNANPLLRFDGYYILSDALRIPNLARRANQYLAYLCQKYVLRIDAAHSQVADRAERRWLVCYGIAAWFYRFFILFAMAVYFLGSYYLISVFLVAIGLFSLVLLPLYKGVRFIAKNSLLHGKRLRVSAIFTSAALAIVTLVCFVPVPWYTVAEGVVWSPENATVRAKADGFVKAIEKRGNAVVAADDTLIVCEDPLLDTRLKITRAKINELRALYNAYTIDDQVRAEIVAGELAGVEAELRHLQERQRGLRVTSPVDGTLVLASADDLSGKFIRKGELLAHVIDEAKMTVKVAIPQNDIGLIREQLNQVAVEARLANNLSAVFPGRITRSTPAATTELPSAALGSFGGGVLTVDPSDAEGRTSIEGIFLLDVELDATMAQAPLGTRVYVRFHHGYLALAGQWYHALSQLFLEEIDA